MKFYIERYGCVGSTNDIAKERGLSGAPEGTVIVAEAQSAGRGRMGRSFCSPGGSGIYMSVLLRPEGNCIDALSVTTRAAAAVARVLERHSGRSASIKWVNDIYMDGRKVCGILAEGVSCGGELSFAVLGIGINLTLPTGDFPEEIKDIAGAVFPGGDSFDRDAIINDILCEFFGGDIDVYREYTERDMLCGEEVAVLSGGVVKYNALVRGIERDFSLRVKKDSGEEICLSSGEVSVKRKGGMEIKNEKD